MTHIDTPTAPTEVHIRITEDNDASRIAAVLEALGYRVMRELDEGDAPQRLEWAVTRLARRHRLTSRERDILALVLDGHLNDSVSRKLGISHATVKWHMHNLFAKTNTGNRESLLRLALQLGSAARSGATPEASASAPLSPPAPARAPAPHTARTAPRSALPRTPSTLPLPHMSPAPAPAPRPAATRSESSWDGRGVTATLDFGQSQLRSAESIPSKLGR